MLKIIYLALFLLLQNSLYAETSIQKYFFIDTQNDFNSTNIYENREIFSKFSDEKNAFGLQTNTVWIHIKLENSSDTSQENIIEFPYPLLDYIEVLEYKDSLLIGSYLTGDLTKFSTRKEDSNTFVLPYKLEAHSSKEFIFGITSKGTLNLKMNFLSKPEYVSQAKDNAIILGIYYGAVLIMLLYNIILYFMIKEKIYLYYVVFHFFYLCVQLGLNGLGFEYIWADTPEINSYFIFAAMALTNYTAILFTSSFLDIKRMHYRLYKYFEVIKFFSILIFISNFIMPYEFNAKAVALLSIISVLSLFLTGVYILIKDRSISSKFFVSAWSFILLGILLTEFSFIGLLPVNFFTLYGNQIGAFIELSLLAIALAYRYNTIFLKLSTTEAELRLFNEELEETVKQRTQTINSKNILLSREVKNKNILLKELFHRVKNNLQIISSILYMQSKKVKHEEANEVLQNSIQIISSMGMIHEKLYKSDDLEFVDFREYLQSLISYMKQTLNGNEVNFNIECKDVMITLKNAVPLGLIVNEIITNSIKHAFDEHSTKTMEISINIDKNSEDLLSLKITDNGKGIELDTLKKNFGFKLIESLATYQLKANIEFYNCNGFGYTISFLDIQEKL